MTADNPTALADAEARLRAYIQNAYRVFERFLVPEQTELVWVKEKKTKGQWQRELRELSLEAFGLKREIDLIVTHGDDFKRLIPRLFELAYLPEYANTFEGKSVAFELSLKLRHEWHDWPDTQRLVIDGVLKAAAACFLLASESAEAPPANLKTRSFVGELCTCYPSVRWFLNRWNEFLGSPATRAPAVRRLSMFLDLIGRVSLRHLSLGYAESPATRAAQSQELFEWLLGEIVLKAMEEELLSEGSLTDAEKQRLDMQHTTFLINRRIAKQQGNA